MKGANLDIYRTVEVHTKDGKLKYRKTERSKSFLIAFLQLIETQMFHLSAVTIKDIANADNATTDHADNLQIDGSGENKGVVVGTGATPPTNTDYVMETKIAHGTGATQLTHGSNAEVTTAEVGANVDYIISRQFTNGSGGTINVTEFGVYCFAYSAGDQTAMIIHDVTSAVPVLNTEVLTVTYTLRTTV